MIWIKQVKIIEFYKDATTLLTLFGEKEPLIHFFLKTLKERYYKYPVLQIFYSGSPKILWKSGMPEFNWNETDEPDIFCSRFEFLNVRPHTSI